MACQALHDGVKHDVKAKCCCCLYLCLATHMQCHAVFSTGPAKPLGDCIVYCKRQPPVLCHGIKFTGEWRFELHGAPHPCAHREGAAP